MSGTSTLKCVPLLGGIEFEVLVTPGSAKACVRGVHGTVLKVAVQAPPEKGRANAEVEAVLADYFGLPKRQVLVISGFKSRNKHVQLMGISAAQAQAKLASA